MNTALSKQIERDEPDSLRALLEQLPRDEMDIDEALRSAVRKNRPNSIRVLVEHGADLEYRDPRTGWPLVHSAVEHGALESLVTLVDLGARLDAVDGAGASALHLAVDVYSDTLEQAGEDPGTTTCELLIELGLDPGMRDREGRTARDWAKETGALALEKLLEYE